MATSPVMLDFSKAQPLPQPVTLDFSKAQPINPPTAPPSLLDRAKAAFDRASTVTPEDQQPHNALTKASPLLNSIGNQMAQFGAGAIHGFGSPIVHPADTLNSIGNMIAHPIDSVHADVNALESDPAKFAGNVVGGAVAGEAAAPMIAPVARAMGTTATRAALLGKTPEAAYESALKPSTTLSQADRASAVQTGLQNEIPISKGGLEKLNDRIDTLNQAIKGQIAQDPTRPIDPNAVATRASAAKAKFANQVNKQGDLNAIEASRQQFLDEQGRKPGVPAQPTGLVDAQGNPIMRPAQPPTPAPPMNASDAQAMKQGTYKVLKGKFGEQGSASVEAQKALARELKEEIATQFPEIGNLNATESRLLDLQPLLERAVGRISNHQVIGIGTPVAGAAAKAITGSGGVGAAAAVLKGVLDNPAVKSRLAIAVSKSANIPIGQAMQRVAAYSSTLGASVASQQGNSSADNPSQPATQQP